MRKPWRIRRVGDSNRAKRRISRSQLLILLTPTTMARLTVGVCGGVAIAFTVDVWTRPQVSDTPWWLNLLGVVAIVAVLTWEGLKLFKRFLAWFPTGRSGSILRRLMAGLASVYAIYWIAATGPLAAWSAATDAVLSALPAIFVLVFGVWAVLLVRRRVVASRHRWLMYATDLVSMAAFGLFIVLLFDLDPLLTRPAAGLLIPVGIWSSVRTWKAMSHSSHFAVSAAADIVLSLLLGTAAVLGLVWVANLLDLPRAELAGVRTTVEHVGSIVDVPWWVWAALYFLLATASLIAALWSARRPAAAQQPGPAAVVPFLDAGRRVLSGVHIGLMVTVLIAVATPVGLESTLRGQMRAKYTLAVQRAFAEQGEQAAYEEIRRHFTASGQPPARVQPLGAMFEKIHTISKPAHPTDGATDTERGLARRLGQVQAGTLDSRSSPPVPAADPATSGLARFDQPIRDSADLTDRLDQLDSQQRQNDRTDRQLEKVGELAAVAVASVVQLPDLGGNEILQVAKEYLGGLVESGPLKGIFSAWARHLVSDAAVPPADRLVIPDPWRLHIAAQLKLAQQRLAVRVADPFVPDQAASRARTEADIEAAVDLTNETRFLAEGRGPCDGCPRPLRPGEEPFNDPGRLPGQERRPGPPEIHVR